MVEAIRSFRKLVAAAAPYLLRHRAQVRHVRHFGWGCIGLQGRQLWPCSAFGFPLRHRRTAQLRSMPSTRLGCLGVCEPVFTLIDLIACGIREVMDERHGKVLV